MWHYCKNCVYVWVKATLLFSLVNWLRDYTSWALVELDWRLKVFPSTFDLCLEIHWYALLFLNFEIYIVHVINCEWSRFVNFPLHMFCMRYKHVFFQHRTHGLNILVRQIYPSKLFFPPLFSWPTTPSFSQKRSWHQYQKQDTVALTQTPKPNEISSPWLKKSFLSVITRRFEKKR